MSDDMNIAIEKILSEYRTIAMVGASPKPERPSYMVADFLINEGYRVIPVTPMAEEVLGEKAHPDLTTITEQIDVVNIFRRSDEVLPVVEQAIAIGAKAIWMQEGVIHEEAACMAREAGLTVVMDRCMKIEIAQRQSP